MLKRKIKFPDLVTQFKNEEKIILRDHLAIIRTRLANERTLFAYIRTFIYLFMGGMAITKISELYQIVWLGEASLILSGIILVFGFVRFYILRRQLNNYYKVLHNPDTGTE